MDVNITGSGTVTYSKRIVISGSVTINLGVGTTLVASSGIEVDEGNELTIEGDGALNAIVADNFYAAIGRGFHGNTPGTSGIININGGIITATGGKFAAGIGGGDTGAGGTIKNTLEYANISGIEPYYCYTGNDIEITYTVTDLEGNPMEYGKDYTAKFSPSTIKEKGDYTLTIMAAGSHYTGSKNISFPVVDNIAVTASTTEMNEKYGVPYKVSNDVHVDSRIKIVGDILLVLDEGETLTASKGIELSKGNKLTIEGNGNLTATGDGNNAGIGARNVGMLVVNGNVLAKGGNNAAGIGGSSNNTSGGTIIINSGEIVAKGGLGAAGIGGGLVGPCGTVSINGGKIVAEGGIYGDLISSGIGPGDYGQKSGTVTLGWTTENDRVFANNFNNVENLQFAKGKRFYMIDGDSIVVATPQNIDGKILYPLIEQNQIGKELSHSDITIAAIPDQTYSGSEICPAVIVNDGETKLTIGTDYTVECSDNVSAGTAKMTITGAGNYVGTVEKTFEIVPKVIHASGAVQVFEDQDGKRAVIDGEYRGDGSVDIPEGIEGVSVEFNRTFTVGKYSTIVLPFEIGEDKVMGADFYKIEDIKVAIKDVDTTWGPVQISKVTGKIEANTPYLLKPTATRLDFVDAVTLNTSEKHPYGFTKAGVQWEFRGTYHFFDFGIDSTHLVGKSYGFAAKDQPDGLKVGDFRWTSDKSYILPMRGYLVYNEVDENKASKKSLQMRYAPRMSVSSVPETLEVEIVDADGGTTVIGQLDTRTGEIRLNGRMADRWFDMQGRVLKGKPTVKGRYLHNGKIEVIK